MSIKIYDGYKIPALGHRELIDFLKNFGQLVRKSSNQMYYRSVVRLAVDIIDSYAIGKSCKQTNKYVENCVPYSEATTDVKKAMREIRQTGLRNPEYDYDCSLSIFPSTKYHLVIINSEKEEHYKIWRKQPGVEKFPYWNNSDRPSRISQRDWDQRLKDWEEVLDLDKPASLFSYTYECVPLYSIPDYSLKVNLEKYIPSYSSRLTSCAKMVLGDEYMQANALNLNSSETMRVYIEFIQSLTTDDGKAILNKKVEELKGKLKEKLKKSDLMQGLPWSE